MGEGIKILIFCRLDFAFIGILFLDFGLLGWICLEI